MTKLFLRDPTGETASSLRERVPPPKDLKNKTIALLDIGKMRGDEFIDRLEFLFKGKCLATIRFKKPTNTRTAPIETIQNIVSKADIVVIALSDCGSCTSCSTHDLNELDKLGVPGVNILTQEFQKPFDGQCEKIGFKGASVFTPHPMQNKTTEELHAFADLVFKAIIEAITLP